MASAKIFCIGFHKTGTTSIGKALEVLGYKNCHGAGSVRSRIGDRAMMKALFIKDYSPFFEEVGKFDSFNDNPWFILYKELDANFPGSKFILTVRETQSWSDSALSYFKDYNTPFRLWIYGKANPLGNESLYQDRFINHNQEVQHYFRDRPDDLLVLDINAINKWDPLCNFLNQEKPKIDFPHLNQFNS